MIKLIKMPKLSANMESGLLVTLRKQNGDDVQKGDVLFEVETEKVVSEIESEEDGKLVKLYFREGDNVKVDEIIAEIEIAE
ncbi:biotin/lipoyl-binding protein [Sedimentibacter hydroxybenzoicus DSM 7310]|uniref:Biotin/lipoyl-binding protein n=1 Tax=Sedimentibacter hydroxybenzoicus DSM 7310 TaxID=1123245 RepID=A0A974BK69_SEDHY|nr:biotin/lipoyl-containing protein [Sedimentibacter hydroxybenzoicus]NYB74165.1 biotin/lipoyl-binding protein [Sedimentibacter hydroxybenzoicus DSM 7310]